VHKNLVKIGRVVLRYAGVQTDKQTRSSQYFAFELPEDEIMFSRLLFDTLNLIYDAANLFRRYMVQ